MATEAKFSSKRFTSISTFLSLLPLKVESAFLKGPSEVRIQHTNIDSALTQVPARNSIFLEEVKWPSLRSRFDLFWALRVDDAPEEANKLEVGGLRRF